jgi:hypothetical protein
MTSVRWPRQVAVIGVAAVFVLSACGTRLPHAQVENAALGGASAATGVPGAPVTSGGVVILPNGSTVPGGPVAGADPGGAGTATAGGPLPSGAATPPTGAPTGRSGAGNPTGTRTPGPAGDNNNAPAGSGGVPGDVVTAHCAGTGGPPIKLGNSGPYSMTGVGGTATPIRAMLNGWAAYVNAHGGICGRQV